MKLYQSTLVVPQGDYYQMHQVVSHVLDGAHHVWRCDNNVATIISETRVDKDRVADVPGVMLVASVGLSLPAAGARITLCVRANAARHAHRKYRGCYDDEIDPWIRARLRGLADVDVSYADEGTWTADRNGQRMWHKSVDVLVSGVVSDAAEFASMLRNGFGRSRRFGFGAITLA